MTDARVPDKWLGDPRFEALSDSAHRVWVSALQWSNRYGTDGQILQTGLKVLHPAGEQVAAFNELVSAGLWESTGGGFQVIGWVTQAGQETAAEIERKRAQNRARQQKVRDKQAAELANLRGSVTRDVTRDVTGYVGQDRIGQDRDRTGLRQVEVSEVEQWETVSIPGSVPADYSAESEAF